MNTKVSVVVLDISLGLETTFRGSQALRYFQSVFNWMNLRFSQHCNDMIIENDLAAPVLDFVGAT